MNPPKKGTGALRRYDSFGPRAASPTNAACPTRPSASGWAAIGKTIHYVNVTPQEATRANLAAGMPPYSTAALAELF
jgi:hypothetical protein